MRSRSNCTSHKLSTRRHLRMIFAVALVSGPGMALAAENLPSGLPGPVDHPEHHEAGLLAYPFAPTLHCDTTRPTAGLGRLVTLVGLQRGNLNQVNVRQQWEGPRSRIAPAPLNRASVQAVHLQPVPSQVVLASGTESTAAGGQENIVLAIPAPELPSLASPDVLAAFPPAESLPPAESPPGLPGSEASSMPPLSKLPPSPESLPGNASQPAHGTVAGHAAESPNEMAHSLIDIAIPLDMMLTPQPSQQSGPPVKSHESSRGVSLLDAPADVPAVRNRQPELIQPAKSLSLTGRQPSIQSVNLSLKDTPSTSPATPKQSAPGRTATTYALSDTSAEDSHSGGRGAALHLSSASSLPLKAAPAAEDATESLSVNENRHFPQRASTMQVRIEGEPAPLLSGHVAQDRHSLTAAAPFPSMGGPASSRMAAGTEPRESSNKVKAALATRVSIVPNRDLERSMNKLGGNAKQQHQPLIIGIQESQTLSAQFVITELSVEHPSICQLMQISESSVSVVGVRPGTTRIALVMVNDIGERQVEVHEVSVSSERAAAQSLPETAAEISRAVGRLAPNSDVEVVAYEDYLLVHGFTHYESDAKKILSLVRKLSLVPVVDQLKSNER